MKRVAETYILGGNVTLLLEAICPKASKTDTLNLETTQEKIKTTSSRAYSQNLTSSCLLKREREKEG